jgi:hypothetical protein
MKGDNSGTYLCSFISHDGGSEFAAKLHVDYTEAGIGDISESDSVTLGESVSVEVDIGIAVVSTDSDYQYTGVRIES